MLSICIPVYNHSIVSLVHTLHRQCLSCSIPFEIICLDDDSAIFFKEKNRSIISFAEVTYEELDKNVGRAVIRNLLAQKAQFNHILYVDSDVLIASDNFISSYLNCIRQGIAVVIGGILYDAGSVTSNTRLHYTYGTSRESRAAAYRKKSPYASFLTGNLLVEKKIVEEIKFLPSLKDYGHEDTLFCIELKKRSIPVKHIDNPVIHEGLETNEVFVDKHLTAVRTLSSLILQGYDMSGISLYEAYRMLKKYFLSGIFIFCLRPFRKKIHQSLISGRSNSLLLFDTLRLYELCIELKKSQKS